jgi:hypothetical protein
MLNERIQSIKRLVECTYTYIGTDHCAKYIFVYTAPTHMHAREKERERGGEREGDRESERERDSERRSIIQ